MQAPTARCRPQSVPQEYTVIRVSEAEIAALPAHAQLELARASLKDLVQLGRCLLVMHETRSFAECGFRSVLHMELGVDPGTLRECMRVGLLLRRLPLLGNLSWEKSQLVVRRAHPDTQQFWLEQASVFGGGGVGATGCRGPAGVSRGVAPNEKGTAFHRIVARGGARGC